MANIKGELVDANLHNSSGDPTPLSTGKVWHDTADSKQKVYDGTEKRTILTDKGTTTEHSVPKYSGTGGGKVEASGVTIDDDDNIKTSKSNESGLSVEIENPDGGADAASKVNLKSDTSSALEAEFALWPEAQTAAALSKRAVLDAKSDVDGVSVVARKSTGEFGVFIGGEDTSDLALRVGHEGSFRVKELGAAPTATPPSGYSELYLKTDKALYTKDSSGTERKVAGGSGSSGINYVSNPDIEVDLTGYEAYADAAGASPVDGTGGSPGSFLELNAIAASVLRGTQSLQFTVPNSNSQGEGFSIPFSIDNVDREKTLYVSFDYYNTNFSNGFRVFVYDIDNATLIGAVSNDDNGYLQNVLSDMVSFSGSFEATDSSNYRLIIHIVNASVQSISPQLQSLTRGSSFIGYHYSSNDSAIYIRIRNLHDTSWS